MEADMDNLLPPVLPDGTTHNWFDLPFDVRHLLYKVMDCETKTSFFLSSEFCAAELPRDSATSINVHGGEPRFEHFSTTLKDSDCKALLSISIKESDGNNCVISSKDDSWRMEVNGSFRELKTKYFQQIVENFFHINRVHITESDFAFENININGLEKLNYLSVQENDPIDLLDCGFINFEKLCSLESVYLHSPLETHQIKQFKAKWIGIKSDKITSKGLNEYLKSFVNCEISENLEVVHLSRTEKWMNAEEVMDGLEVLEHCKSRGIYELDKQSFAIISRSDAIGIVNINISIFRCSLHILVLSKEDFYKSRKWVAYYGEAVNEYFENKSKM